MGGPRTGGTAAVMRVLESAPRGVTVYLADVVKQAAAAGVTLTDQQAKNAIYHVMSRRYSKPFRVEVVLAGQAWRVLDPATSPAQEARNRMRRQLAAEAEAPPAVGEVLEILAVTKTGTLIVQDERGDTWKATKVE